MKELRYKPIGVIHSPFKEAKGTPIQPAAADGAAGIIELEPEYCDGLEDIQGFSHIILVYHFHLSRGYSLKVKPFLDDRLHGIFSTRAPRRPNQIGISIVRLIKVEGCRLYIEDVDIVDGAPLLDIKPYVPEFDTRQAERTGWISGKTEQVCRTKADERFL